MSVKESVRYEAPPKPQREVDPAQGKPLWQRIGWLLIIWTGSVLALFVVAMLLRMFMTAAGMKSH
ncbi:DUF2474 domain-containing protein [Pseudomonas sp. KU26590]|uniref:DUF2474 domain-containing protein n=1 Tax=Pseudomonas sp. KU26590 TaxID=2991051 RepID=UPI00223E6B83|nr:DUF2474 domain-containing protein [Pseudomonas sp. KU26590]UZJ59787.1 DUF2474 domain-containing protein [Pseudomonas sp. KU26590]